MANEVGKVFRVVGPVVEMEGVTTLRMLDMVEVGDQHLIGEVVRLKGDHAFLQVYEDTTSIKSGDPVYSEGSPLYVELGPGLLGTIYDGIQRPLQLIKEQEGVYISRGVHVTPLDRKKKWHFAPVVKAGDELGPGQIIGEVQEAPLVKHRVMLAPEVKGKLN